MSEQEVLERRTFQIFSATANRRVAHTGGQGNDSETSLEYARRLVATWNACAGIPTETLEEGPLEELQERAGMAEARADNLAKRLAEIAQIIENVDNRCMAADGPVTPTLKEMTQTEISRIYKLASEAKE